MERNWLLPFTYIALGLLNIVYFTTKYLPTVPGFLDYSYRFISENLFFFTFLEFLGVASVFVDFIISYDKGQKAMKMILTGLFVFAFLAKIFVNYMESAMT